MNNPSPQIGIPPAEENTTLDKMAAFLPLFWDIGLSVVIYYAARSLDFSPNVSNAAALVALVARLVYVAVRSREFDWLAAAMILVFGLALGLSVMTGDTRVVVLKDSVISVVIALAVFAAQIFGRPAIYQVARRFAGTTPEKAAGIEALWDTKPGYRHVISVLSIGIGVGCLIEAAVRVVLIFVLPVDVLIGMSQVLQIVAIVALFGWIVVYGRRTAHTWK